MPLSQKYIYTSEDYWNLPEGRRAELIDGQIYDIAPPGFKHQKIISQFSYRLNDYIRQNGGDCEVIPAPFAVNLDADDKNWVITEITGKKRRYAPIKEAYRDTAKGAVGKVSVLRPAAHSPDYMIRTGFITAPLLIASMAAFTFSKG